MDYYFHFIVSQALIDLKLSQLLTVILVHFNMPMELPKIAKVNLIFIMEPLILINNYKREWKVIF